MMLSECQKKKLHGQKVEKKKVLHVLDYFKEWICFKEMQNPCLHS